MAKQIGFERLIELIADRIKDGVTRSLREFMDEEFRDLKRKMVAAGIRRGPGRPPGSARGRRRGRPPKKSGRPAVRSGAVDSRRKKILSLVKAANGGISSVAVAKKMRKDPRGIGILLSGLAKEGAVKKAGKLYQAV
jgi:hypothetical protein